MEQGRKGNSLCTLTPYVLHCVKYPIGQYIRLMKFFLFLSAFFFFSCQSRDTLFKEVPSQKSGIHFNNEIHEDENLNVLRYEYLYNGGGVGVGDFNNDNLPDIYFTGNRVANKLYINRGNFKFED